MNVAYYRDLYQRAWKIKPTARVLTSLPHYMILDDHEIFDDYYNGKPYGRSAAFGGVADGQAVRGAALAAYKEYQHSHNPQPFPLPALYYEWGYGGVEFFAMDVRTERYGEPHSQMVGTVQMQALKDWLTRHAQATKFVITSVPFVGEARNAEDKWSGPAFQPQRDELVDFLAARPEIERLVFLTGDMHCSYHATMTIHRQDGTELLVHELMSSPINQFCNGFPAFLERADHRTAANTAYEVALKEEEFYGRHSNVMLVRATPRGLISWNVYRTKGVTEPPTPALPGVVPFQL